MRWVCWKEAFKKFRSLEASVAEIGILGGFLFGLANSTLSTITHTLAPSSSHRQYHITSTCKNYPSISELWVNTASSLPKRLQTELRFGGHSAFLSQLILLIRKIHQYQAKGLQKLRFYCQVCQKVLSVVLVTRPILPSCTH